MQQSSKLISIKAQTLPSAISCQEPNKENILNGSIRQKERWEEKKKSFEQLTGIWFKHKNYVRQQANMLPAKQHISVLEQRIGNLLS